MIHGAQIGFHTINIGRDCIVTLEYTDNRELAECFVFRTKGSAPLAFAHEDHDTALVKNNVLPGTSYRVLQLRDSEEDDPNGSGHERCAHQGAEDASVWPQ